MASTRRQLDEIVASFATLEDPHSHINRRHPLPEEVGDLLDGVALIDPLEGEAATELQNYR
jgi:hypothetical protein